MSNLLNQYISHQAKEVQFRLGYRTTFKQSGEWIETDQSELSLSEWEDLKDFCLKPHEKIILETKGFIKGVFQDEKHTWVFSFAEWKENLKAHFSYIPHEIKNNNIQHSHYWESLNHRDGIHIISGARQSGKSILLGSILMDTKKNRPDQVAVHAEASYISTLSHDSIFNLGIEAVQWEPTHPFYDGIDTVVLDINEVTNWKKWLRFSEEGKRVFLTMSAQSVENTLMQIKSYFLNDSAAWYRFISQIKTILNQKMLGLSEGTVNEILVLRDSGKSDLLNHHFNETIQKMFESSHFYQSYNQSIIQALVRRRIDVKTAFECTPYPEDLDQQLKKMGL